MAMKPIGERTAAAVLEPKERESRVASNTAKESASEIVDTAKARALAALVPPCGVRHIFDNSSLNPQQELATKVLLAAAAMMMAPSNSQDLKS